jgi:hypothetical protein
VKRVPAHVKILSGLLTRHFSVEAVWIQAYLPFEQDYGTVLEICGTDANVRTAEHVHTYVLRTAESLWQAYKRQQGLRGGGQRARYLVGVMMGLGESLQASEAQCQETGLVWVQDAQLEDWFSRRHPQLRSGRKITYTGGRAVQEGKAAGRSIQLHDPIEASGRKLLGG